MRSLIRKDKAFFDKDLVLSFGDTNKVLGLGEIVEVRARYSRIALTGHNKSSSFILPTKSLSDLSIKDLGMGLEKDSVLAKNSGI